MKNLMPIFLLCFVNACAVQTEFDFDTNDTAGFVEERLERIDDAVNADIAAGKIPGAVALIFSA